MVSTLNIFNLEKLNLFWNFVCERQNIYYKRNILRLKQPWTSDKILQKERFTNIYRELDPGTKYAIDNILEIEASKQDKIFNIMFYRLIGRSDTHKLIGFQKLNNFNSKSIENKLKFIRDIENKPVFTAAYMVGGYTKMGSKDKIENVIKLFTNLKKNFNLFYSKIESCKNPEEVYNVIKSEYGFGNFLAYQILVDLLYPLRIYNNEPLLPYLHNTWSSPGPGARKGINLILKERAKPLEVMKWLKDNQEKEFKRLNLDFKYLEVNKIKINISLANIQNCLCEFHKYIKISNGTGRGRRKFISLS